MTQSAHPAAGPAAADSTEMVSIRGVSRTFGSGHTAVQALREVSLTVRKGQLVALCGRSGSGKTTLLNIIGGLDSPTSGSVLIGGRDVTRMPERERTALRRRDVAFIFQSFGLIPVLSAAENVGVPLRIAGVSAARREERVRMMLAIVGLSGHAAQRPGELSGGQQQRVAIARALAGDPAVLLADEPTASLDAENGQAVMGMLSGLARDRGLSLVIVTHDNRIAPFADRILRLEDGRLDGDGAEPGAGHPHVFHGGRREEVRA